MRGGARIVVRECFYRAVQKSHCRRSHAGVYSGHRGAGLLELAISIPVVLIMTGILLQVGSDLHERVVLLEGTRVAARTAGSEPDPLRIDVAAQDAFDRFIRSVGYDPGRYLVTIMSDIDLNDPFGPLPFQAYCAAEAVRVTAQPAASGRVGFMRGMSLLGPVSSEFLIESSLSMNCGGMGG